MNKQITRTIYTYYLFSFLRNFMLLSGILVPFFTQWGQLNLFQIQLLQSWFVLWVFLLEVPTGAIADRFGRKISICLGLFITAIAMFLYGLLTGFSTFLVLELFFALGVALMSGADQALLYDTLKEAGRESESKKIIGNAHAITLTSLALSAPIGSLIAGITSVQFTVSITAVPLLLAAIVAMRLKEPQLKKKVSESRRYVQIATEGFKFLYSHSTLRSLAIDGIVVAAAGYFVIWLYQPLLSQVGVPLFYFGFIHAVLVGAQILISTNLVRLEKLFGSTQSMLKYSAVLVAGAFFLAALIPNPVTALVFIVLAGGFGLTRLELMFSYMHVHIPSDKRATVLSSVSMFRRLALVPLNPFVGYVADQSLQVAFFAIGILPLLVYLFSPIKEHMFED
jgi:MFS family permease